MSWAVRRRHSAASFTFLASFHRMDAQPSGEMTEYTAFSKIHTWSATPRARAPPLPPSPMSTDTMGVRRPAIFTRFSAMAWPWPRSSAPRPQ